MKLRNLALLGLTLSVFGLAGCTNRFEANNSAVEPIGNLIGQHPHGRIGVIRRIREPEVDTIVRKLDEEGYDVHAITVDRMYEYTIVYKQIDGEKEVGND